VSEYPSENTFMMYSETEDAPENVRSVLENLQNYSAGLRVSELISQIASELQKALADGSRDNPFSLEDDEMDEVVVDDDDDDDDDWSHSPPHEEEHTYISINPEAAIRLNKRIREDLRAVRNAGFRVGILRGLKADSQASFLSISVQVSRLGLSDEAIQAWDLEKQQHVVLLIRYAAGYKSFDAVISEAARSHEVEFRVGISNRYKPTVTEAIAAFTAISKREDGDSNDGSVDDGAQSQTNDSPADFGSLFISSSLNGFINEQFISLLKIRHNMGVGWYGAKLFYSDNQGRAGLGPPVDANGLTSNYYSESTTAKNGLPVLVTADHIRDTRGDRFSFPLIAMQFVMRYLTRCTEFCLICHDKTLETFEALKPYVCSKPLCLYQVSLDNLLRYH
jgi:ubiquitin-conjugating enzyme E2 Q